jgi:hypothetical protein
MCLANFAVSAANAQECIPGLFFASRSPYWNCNVVFIGTATASESMDDHAVAQLKVEKIYRGSLDDSVQVSSQMKSFVVGQKYFVYAWQDPSGKLSITSPCGDTKALETAADDVEYAEDIAAGKLGTRIYGWAIKSFQNEPLVGAVVKIKSKKNTFSTKTDGKGIYVFKEIPTGTYSVEIDQPKGLHLLPTANNTAIIDATATTVPTVPLFLSPGPAKKLSSRWFNINFGFSDDQGSVKGRVTDQFGKVPPQRPLSLVWIDKSGKVDLEDIVASSYSDPLTGDFLFKMVPPGKYLLAVNPLNCHTGDPQFGQTFFPGVARSGDATVISVDAVQNVKLKQLFKLPPPRVERSISGVLLRSDNSPVIGATVYIWNPSQRQPGLCFGNVGEATTNDTGRFILRGYEGYSYNVRAYVELDGPQQPKQRLYSEIVEISPAGTANDIRLVLARGSEAGP